MSTEYPDAKSRMIKLLDDFTRKLDELDMEQYPTIEPNKSVKFLLDAVRPWTLRKAMRDKLELEEFKSKKKSVMEFTERAIPLMEGFQHFEGVIKADNAHKEEMNKKTQAGPPGTTKTSVGAVASSNKDTEGEKKPVGATRSCFSCQSKDHGVFQCPDITIEEARSLYEEKTGKTLRKSKNKEEQEKPKMSRKVSNVARVGIDKSSKYAPTIPCMVMGDCKALVTPDSGADLSLAAPSFVKRLLEEGKIVEIRELKEKILVSGFSNDTKTEITKEVKLDLQFDTPNGKLKLRNVNCWIAPNDLPTDLGDILLSRPVMRRLGYDPEERLRNAFPVYDLEENGGAVLQWEPKLYDTGVGGQSFTDEDALLHKEEKNGCFPEMDLSEDEDARQVRGILKAKVQDAKVHGCSEELATRLEELLLKKADVFRTILGRNPPVSMPPLKVELKPDAVPVRCKARRYPQEHRECMTKHTKELRDAGLCFLNPRSK